MTHRMLEDVQQFKKSEDMIGRFIDECLYTSLDNRISAKLVYDVFCSWQGKNPIAFSEFLKKMEHKGYVNKQRRMPDGSRITGFEGLGISADYLVGDVNQSRIESLSETAVCA